MNVGKVRRNLVSSDIKTLWLTLYWAGSGGVEDRRGGGGGESTPTLFLRCFKTNGGLKFVNEKNMNPNKLHVCYFSQYMFIIKDNLTKTSLFDNWDYQFDLTGSSPNQSNSNKDIKKYL